MILKMINKIVALSIILTLVFEQSGFAQLAGPMGIPAYINGYVSPDKFRPLQLRSLTFDQIKNDFNLYLDKGDLQDLRPKEIKENAAKISEYFQIGLRLPNSTFWVNLRPDAQDQIIDPWLEKTDLGKVMLEADLQLKKDMANFTSPRTDEGKKYWDALYKKAEELFGQSEITIPTLTRPWIVPGEILIRETTDNAYIYKAVLKVMLEQDYLKDSQEYKFDDLRLKTLNEYSSQLIRREILPKLTREVNSSKNYAGLRQVYYSLVLAQWFKQSHSDSKVQLTNKIDSYDLTGLTSKKSWSKTTYFKAYQKSFAKGEYKIQETVNRLSGTSIRQYFSGGEKLFIPQGGIGRINPLADGGVSNDPSLPEYLKSGLIEVQGGSAANLSRRAQELYSAINEISLRAVPNQDFVERRLERVKGLIRENKYSPEEIREVKEKLNLMGPILERVEAGKINSLLFSVGTILAGGMTIGALIFSGMSLVPMLLGISFTAAFGIGAGYSLHKLFNRDIPTRGFYSEYEREINRILAAAEDAARGLEIVKMVRKLAAEQNELRDRYLNVSLPRFVQENSDVEDVKAEMFAQKKELFKAALVLREVAKAYGAPTLTYDQIEKNDVVISYEARDYYWFLALSGAEALVQYSYIQNGFSKSRFFSVNELQKILESAAIGEGQGLKDGGSAQEKQLAVESILRKLDEEIKMFGQPGSDSESGSKERPVKAEVETRYKLRIDVSVRTYARELAKLGTGALSALQEKAQEQTAVTPRSRCIQLAIEVIKANERIFETSEAVRSEKKQVKDLAEENVKLIRGNEKWKDIYRSMKSRSGSIIWGESDALGEIKRVSSGPILESVVEPNGDTYYGRVKFTVKGDSVSLVRDNRGDIVVENINLIEAVLRETFQGLDKKLAQGPTSLDGGASFTKEELKALVNSPAAFGHFLRFREKRFNGLNAPLKSKATRERLIKLFESQRDAEAIIWADTQSDGLMEDVDAYFRIMKKVGFNFRELGLLAQATGAFNYFYKTKLIPQGSRKAMDKEERDAKRQLMAAVVERTREAAKRRDSQLAGILSSVARVEELEMLIRAQFFINSLRKLEFNLTDELKALVNPSLTESAGVFEDFFNKAFPSARPDGDNYKAQMSKARFRLQQLLARASLIKDEPVIKIILSVENEAQLVLAIRAQQYIIYLKQYGFDINFLRRFSGASDSKNVLERIFAADEVSEEFLDAQLNTFRNVVERMNGLSPATPTVAAMLSVLSGKEMRLLKKIQAYQNSRSSQTNLKDGGTTTTDKLGGIDFRALPAAVTPMINPAAAGAALISLKDLEEQWSDIQSKIYQGKMPYQEIKLYVNSCCGQKAAVKQLEQVSEGITNTLKMEEDRALPTAPELKEILAYLG